MSWAQHLAEDVHAKVDIFHGDYRVLHQVAGYEPLLQVGGHLLSRLAHHRHLAEHGEVDVALLVYGIGQHLSRAGAAGAGARRCLRHYAAAHGRHVLSYRRQVELLHQHRVGTGHHNVDLVFGPQAQGLLGLQRHAANGLRILEISHVSRRRAAAKPPQHTEQEKHSDLSHWILHLTIVLQDLWVSLHTGAYPWCMFCQTSYYP